MKKTLVTGATGFIGSALCARLSKANKKVRAAVRGPSRAASPVPGWEQAEIGELGPDTNWCNILGDIEEVVHLAARVHVMRDRDTDPLSAYRRVNTAGTLNLARQAAAAGVRRFVYLSSVKVNGEQTSAGRPFTEEDEPAPVDPYGRSKMEAEQGLRALAEVTGLEVVIIRPPLVYGPGAKANFLTMMRWLHKGVPLPLGAIHNSRSLVALDNLVDLIIACLDHPAAANQVFLVGDGEDLSTTELLRRLGNALNKPAWLLPVSPRLLEAGAAVLGGRDVVRRLCGSLQVDITKARTVLGWNPPVSVDDALRATARHFLESQRAVGS